MRQFGLIGYPLGHSFSAKYFGEKFAKEGIDAVYRLYEIAPTWFQVSGCRFLADGDECVPGHFTAGETPASSVDECVPGHGGVIEQVRLLDGFNVTSPYKEAVIPYLDALDETARAVGAVNVVAREGDRWIGYNTDCIGFREDIQEFDHLPIRGVQALVLGTGGAAKAVTYALRKLNIPYTMVSRTPEVRRFGETMVINYEALLKEIMDEHRLIINCTPVGMGEYQNECPRIPYQWLSCRHFLYDCIYNPSETLFLQRGKEQGAHTRNGIGMLTHQADAAWRIWSKN